MPRKPSKYAKYLEKADEKEKTKKTPAAKNTASADIVSGAVDEGSNTEPVVLSGDDYILFWLMPVPDEPYKLRVPAAQVHADLFERLNAAGYMSLEDFDRVCLIVAGDLRRIIQRVLLCIQQRAFKVKDVDTMTQMRVYLTLHEREALLPLFQRGVVGGPVIQAAVDRVVNELIQ